MSSSMMIDSTSRLLDTAMSAMMHPLISDEAFLALVDDDWVDQRDALDCECVSYESVETELAEALYEEDLIGSGHYAPEVIYMDEVWNEE